MPNAKKIEFRLLAIYDGAPLLPVHDVAETWFGMTISTFLEHCRDGKISLPIVSMGATQKSKKMVPVDAPAAYIDRQEAEAYAEMENARVVRLS